MKKFLSVFSILFILTSCGTMQEREFRAKIAENVKNKNYDEALKLAKDEEFYKGEKSKLLKNLEIGTIYYLDGKYYQALKSFEQAKKISDDLYTISVSKKISSIWDENMDNYYGEKYERSLIRFYLSLINYNLYKQGYYEEYLDDKNVKVEKKVLTDSEKNFHLNYARSSIIEWDSLLKSYQGETGGEPVYKNDMIAKVWGAFIHSEFENSTDRQIAIQLYKDGNELLLRNYNMYPIYNNKAKNFSNDFKKLPNITYQELVSQYIDETQYAKDLKEYLDRSINNLNRFKKDNLVIVLKDSLVSPKSVNTIKVPIPIALFGNSYSQMEAFIRLIMLTENGMPYAEIELPKIDAVKNIKRYKFVVFNEANEEIAKSDLAMIEPISDIAKKTLDDKLGMIRTKIIARVGAKYAAAAISAYALYSQDNDFAKLGALAMFAGSVKAINESSRADTRYWTTLFSDLQIGGAILNTGKYKLVIYDGDKSIVEREFEIKRNETTFIDLNI